MTQYLAFDIGGTNLKYALMDKTGRIIEKGRIPTHHESLNAFMSSVYQVGDEYRNQFEGIAVCAPGKIDTKKKIIHFGGALPFLDGLNLEDTLGKKYQVPVGVENDGKAAALCEQWLGKLHDVDTGAVMTLGTAVGGGILINGHVLHGRDFQAGELSWMITNSSADTQEMDAFTGKLCSAVEMIMAVNEVVGNKDKTNGQAAFEAIQAKNIKAMKIFQKYCSNVAIMIMNVQAVINSERIVIGGGISAQPILIEEIKHQFKLLLAGNEMLKNQVIPPEIVAAKYRNDANLYGALYALLLEINGQKVR